VKPTVIEVSGAFVFRVKLDNPDIVAEAGSLTQASIWELNEELSRRYMGFGEITFANVERQVATVVELGDIIEPVYCTGCETHYARRDEAEFIKEHGHCKHCREESE
jgi:hypothetical protein